MSDGIAPAFALGLSRADWRGRAALSVAEDPSETPIAQVLLRQRRINDEIEGEFGCRYLRGEEDPGLALIRSSATHRGYAFPGSWDL